MVITNRVVVSSKAVAKNNISQPALLQQGTLSPEQFYERLHCNYPKFFKMDKLCKWAVVAAEYLFAGNELYTAIDKNKIAVALFTSHGCMEVDKRYHDAIALPSPALFVYTLPNIMLGEICIRHGFKGDQLCMVSDQFDPAELYFATNEFIVNRNMEACLCGWVDVNGEDHDIRLFWVTKQGAGEAFTPTALQ